MEKDFNGSCARFDPYLIYSSFEKNLNQSSLSAF